MLRLLLKTSSSLRVLCCRRGACADGCRHAGGFTWRQQCLQGPGLRSHAPQHAPLWAVCPQLRLVPHLWDEERGARQLVLRGLVMLLGAGPQRRRQAGDAGPQAGCCQVRLPPKNPALWHICWVCSDHLHQQAVSLLRQPWYCTWAHRAWLVQGIDNHSRTLCSNVKSQRAPISMSAGHPYLSDAAEATQASL